MERNTYTRMAEIQAVHWWYEGRRRILASLTKSLKLKPGAAILEAGCGPGANLAMLAQFGNVSAFEPDRFARSHAEKESGILVKQGGLPSNVPFAGPFDLVGAFDVIEHVQEDLASLRTLHALTAKGGYALFTVPAFMFLWSPHDVANHHKRRYTKREFRRILEEAGYKIEFISYYNTLLFPAVAGVRAAKNIFKITGSPDEKMPSPFMNTLLCFIFSLERFLLKITPLPFGVSIIVLCRKP
jgi:SAM-dependent methyltransferase